MLERYFLIFILVLKFFKFCHNSDNSQCCECINNSYPNPTANPPIPDCECPTKFGYCINQLDQNKAECVNMSPENLWKKGLAGGYDYGGECFKNGHSIY